MTGVEGNSEEAAEQEGNSQSPSKKSQVEGVANGGNPENSGNESPSKVEEMERGES